MSLPTRDTAVSYPSGAVESTGTVLHVEDLPDGRRSVLLDATAVHPVDAAWPDQGADRAVLTTAAGAAYDVQDAVVAATDGTALFLGADIPVKKGAEGWAFTVAHLLPAGAAVAEGDAVRIDVDLAYRTALSAGHTACHLASLALNRQLAGGWKKEVAQDAAGNPNFDALAIASSTISAYGSTDVYRLGKSLRRRGFLPDALPEGPVSIPCGGTHAASLAETGGIQVALTAAGGDGAVTLTMDTACMQPAG